MQRPGKLQWFMATAAMVVAAFLAMQAQRLTVKSGWSDSIGPASDVAKDKLAVDAFLGGAKEYTFLFLHGRTNQIPDNTFLQALTYTTAEMERSGYFVPDSIKSVGSLKKLVFQEGSLESGNFFDADALPLTPEECKTLERNLRQCSFIRDSFLSDSLQSTLVIATYDGPPKNRLKAREWQRALEATLSDRFGVDATLLDDVSVNAEIDRQALTDTTLWPGLAAMATAITCFFLCGRRWLHVVGFFLLAGLSISSLLGIIVLLGYDYGVMFTFLPILLILSAGSDYPYFAHKDHYDSPGKILRALWAPLALSAVTTAISAGSLAVSHIDQIRQFGIVAAVGIVLNTTYSLSVIPVFFYVARRLLRGGKIEQSLSVVDVAVMNAARWLHATRLRSCVAVGVVALLSCIALVMAALVPWTDDYIRDYFPPNSHMALAAEKGREAFGGFDCYKVLVNCPAGFDQLPTLQRLADLQRRMEQISYRPQHATERVAHLLKTSTGKDIRIKENSTFGRAIGRVDRLSPPDPIRTSTAKTVAHTFSLIDLVGYVNQQWQGDSNASLPGNQLAYTYILDNFMGELRHQYENDIFNEDLTAATVDVVMNSSDTRVHQQVYDGIKALALDYPEFEVHLGGYQMKWLMYKTDILRVKMRSIFLDILGVGLLSGVVYFLIRRSFRLASVGALLVVVPIIIGFVWVLAFMFLCGIKINIATATISNIGLGVSVNFAIHLVYGMLTERDFEACLPIVRALFVDLIVSLCFLFLLGSAIPSIRHSGLIIAVAVSCAFVLTVVLIPALAPKGIYKREE